jgi:hypothetical protein
MSPSPAAAASGSLPAGLATRGDALVDAEASGERAAGRAAAEAVAEADAAGRTAGGLPEADGGGVSLRACVDCAVCAGTAGDVPAGPRAKRGDDGPGGFAETASGAPPCSDHRR